MVEKINEIWTVWMMTDQLKLMGPGLMCIG